VLDGGMRRFGCALTGITISSKGGRHFW
jgi:hypothetical protein